MARQFPRSPLPWDIRILGIADLILGVLAAVSFVASVGSVGPLITAIVYLCVGWGLLGSFRGARSLALWLTVCVPLILAVVSLVLGAVLPLTGITVREPGEVSTSVAALSWLAFAVWIAVQAIVLLRPKARELFRDSHFLDRAVDRFVTRRA